MRSVSAGTRSNTLAIVPPSPNELTTPHPTPTVASCDGSAHVQCTLESAAATCPANTVSWALGAACLRRIAHSSFDTPIAPDADSV